MGIETGKEVIVFPVANQSVLVIRMVKMHARLEIEINAGNVAGTLIEIVFPKQISI